LVGEKCTEDSNCKIPKPYVSTDSRYFENLKTVTQASAIGVYDHNDYDLQMVNFVGT
jgi:hypothetical protein